MSTTLSQEFEVIWEPQKGPQEALLSCPVFEVFFGGARGGGKTDGMLGEWVSHQDQYGSAAIGLMVRRELTQLIETIERSKQIYTQLGAKFHEQEKLWRFPNGSRLRFAYLERDSDADAYQGHSYSRVYVEEIGTFPSASPILKLMATLRSGSGIPCGFRATGNPGGPGHQWVRSRYIDPAPLGMKVITEIFENPWNKEKVTRERVYIPSKLQDNRYLGSEYVANLQMVGNAQLVRAWLEGDWSVIEGAFFPEFQESKHVIPPLAIPDTWLRFRSCDWGSARPFSVGWWAVCGDTIKTTRGDIIPKGAIVRYREWYGASSPNVGLKLPAEAVADGILSREGQEPKTPEGKPNIAYGIIDPAAYISDGGPSIAERMAKRGVLFRRADNARVAARGALGGWDQLRARLVGDGERPMIYFTSNCVDSIRTLPALQHDTNRPEDVDSEGEDHCFASGTMVLTPNGPIEIQDLPFDGLIMSQHGVEHYTGRRKVKRETDVVRLSFSDGSTIRCTPDHKFMTANGEWKQAIDFLDETGYAIKAWTPSLSHKLFSLLRAATSIYAANTSRIKEGGSIALSGLRLMEQSRMDTMSITRIITDQITLSTILNFSLSESISAVAMGLTRPNALLNHLGRHERQRGFGMVLRLVKNGTQNILKNTLGRLSNAELKRTVSIAAQFIWYRLLRLIGESGVAQTVRRVHCVSVEPVNVKEDVYCLTVGKTGCFALGNGLIVANCPDEIRYACMSRPYIRQVEKKPEQRIISVGPTNQVTLEDLFGSQPFRRRERV